MTSEDNYTAVWRDTDAFVETLMDCIKIPGLALAIINKNGTVLYRRGYGVTSNDHEGRPVDENTIFSIGSTTKAFTSALLGQLKERGLVDWDTPIKEYLPGFEFWDSRYDILTLRDLLTHHSGFSDIAYNTVAYAFADESVPLETRLFNLRHLMPKWGPREYFGYNDWIFTLAGYIAGQRSSPTTGTYVDYGNNTWEWLVENNIFDKVGMHRSRTSIEEVYDIGDENVAKPHVAKRENIYDVVPFPIDILRYIGRENPAGGIFSTITDMTKWAQVLLNGGTVPETGEKIISASTLEELTAAQRTLSPNSFIVQVKNPFTERYVTIDAANYGMGWFVGSYNGQLWIHHGGTVMGMCSQVSLFPHSGWAIVTLGNRDHTNSPQNNVHMFVIDRLYNTPSIMTAESVCEHFEEFEKDDSPQDDDQILSESMDAFSTWPQSSTPDPIFVGNYSHPFAGVVSITINATTNSLFLRYGKIFGPLIPLGGPVFNFTIDTWDLMHYSWRIVFSYNTKGQVDACFVPIEPAVPPVLFVSSHYNQASSIAIDPKSKNKVRSRSFEPTPYVIPPPSSQDSWTLILTVMLALLLVGCVVTAVVVAAPLLVILLILEKDRFNRPPENRKIDELSVPLNDVVDIN